MDIIRKSNHAYYFDPQRNPAAEISSGEAIWFETMDCFSDTLISQKDKEDTQRYSNPVTGPLYISGAEPGDTLKIHIDDIIIDTICISGIGPGLKCFKNLSEFMLNTMEINNNLLKINDKIEVTIEPMIGTIGVSPNYKILSVLSGDYGGNMDCRLVKKGSYIYLPVFVTGGLLSIGDLHAIMGDGEVCECGAETRGKVKVSIEVIKDTKRKTPSIEFEDKWITIATRQTADEAINAATEYMYNELVEKLSINYAESALLLNLLGNLTICASNDYYTVARMDFPIEVMEKYNFIRS